MIKFEIVKTFSITKRNYLVLSGTVLNGEVTRGMRILFHDQIIPIRNIEFLDRIQTSTKSMVSLVIECDEKKLEKYSELFHEGMIIELQ